MDSTGKTSRREFIKLTTAATVAAATSTTILAAKEPGQPVRVSPADKIRLGLIGAGGQGMGDTREALKIPGSSLWQPPTSTTDGSLEQRRSGETSFSPRVTIARSWPVRTSTRSSSLRRTTGICGCRTMR